MVIVDFQKFRCYTKRFENQQNFFLWFGDIEKVQYNDIGMALNTIVLEQMFLQLLMRIYQVNHEFIYKRSVCCVLTQHRMPNCKNNLI